MSITEDLMDKNKPYGSLSYIIFGCYDSEAGEIIDLLWTLTAQIQWEENVFGNTGQTAIQN